MRHQNIQQNFLGVIGSLRKVLHMSERVTAGKTDKIWFLIELTQQSFVMLGKEFHNLI